MKKINLFTGYFKGKDRKRQKELDFCLNKNLDNELFDKVITFKERPKYSDFFEHTKDYPDHINIFANADIYFNDTIKHVERLHPTEAYAITRWEWVKGSIKSFEERNHYNRGAQSRHSQDVWIFNGTVSRPVFGAFYIGIPGCDNRIAYEILRAGYKLYNPCRTIQVIHRHDNDGREYHIPDGSPQRIGPPYRWVEPCAIVRGGYSTQQLQKHKGIISGRRAV